MEEIRDLPLEIIFLASSKYNLTLISGKETSQFGAHSAATRTLPSTVFEGASNHLHKGENQNFL